MFFLELSCFFNDLAYVDNLISGSSAFSKTSLKIWKFTVYVLLKPGLENFEHVRWVQLCGSLSILWHCLSLGLEWKLTFSSPVATAVFQICWHIECSTFIASSFRIWCPYISQRRQPKVASSSKFNISLLCSIFFFKSRCGSMFSGDL